MTPPADPFAVAALAAGWRAAREAVRRELAPVGLPCGCGNPYRVGCDKHENGPAALVVGGEFHEDGPQYVARIFSTRAEAEAAADAHRGGIAYAVPFIVEDVAE